MEGTYNFEQGSSTGIDLAEQDIVSCDSTNYGCSGGFSARVYDYLESSTVCDESCFPYKASDVSCSQRCSWNKNGWKVSSVERPSTVEAAKARLVCGGPIAVCSNNWRHCITLVAYDDDSSICQDNYGTKGCWIIKNSWGNFNGVDKYCSVYHVNGYGYIPYSGHDCSDIVEGSTSLDVPAGPKGIIAP
jgi:C1A family cysteine protease